MSSVISTSIRSAVLASLSLNALFADAVPFYSLEGQIVALAHRLSGGICIKGPASRNTRTSRPSSTASFTQNAPLALRVSSSAAQDDGGVAVFNAVCWWTQQAGSDGSHRTTGPASPSCHGIAVCQPTEHYSAHSENGQISFRMEHESSATGSSFRLAAVDLNLSFDDAGDEIFINVLDLTDEVPNEWERLLVSEAWAGASEVGIIDDVHHGQVNIVDDPDLAEALALSMAEASAPPPAVAVAPSEQTEQQAGIANVVLSDLAEALALSMAGAEPSAPAVAPVAPEINSQQQGLNIDQLDINIANAEAEDDPELAEALALSLSEYEESQRGSACPHSAAAAVPDRPHLEYVGTPGEIVTVNSPTGPPRSLEHVQYRHSTRDELVGLNGRHICDGCDRKIYFGDGGFRRCRGEDYDLCRTCFSCAPGGAAVAGAVPPVPPDRAYLRFLDKHTGSSNAGPRGSEHICPNFDCCGGSMYRVQYRNAKFSSQNCCDLCPGRKISFYEKGFSRCSVCSHTICGRHDEDAHRLAERQLPTPLKDAERSTEDARKKRVQRELQQRVADEAAQCAEREWLDKVWRRGTPGSQTDPVVLYGVGDLPSQRDLPVNECGNNNPERSRIGVDLSANLGVQELSGENRLCYQTYDPETSYHPADGGRQGTRAAKRKREGGGDGGVEGDAHVSSPEEFFEDFQLAAKLSKVVYEGREFHGGETPAAGDRELLRDILTRFGIPSYVNPLAIMAGQTGLGIFEQCGGPASNGKNTLWLAFRGRAWERRGL